MKKILLVPAIVGAILLTGCSQQPDSVQNDQNVSNDALTQLQKSQPVPVFNYSQERQTLISVEEARAHVVATTTFFFNQGVQDPIASCPSIGFPLATTTELTNPSQVVWGGNGASGTVGQADPTGVYTGDSSGTYVDCVNDKGQQYVQYWEGFVQTIGGPATWDSAKHQVVLTGEPTVKVKQK